MINRHLIAVGLGLVVALAATASGEIIVRKNGARLQGRIVSQDAKEVVVEVTMGAARMVTAIPREEIDKILPDPEPAKPTENPDKPNPADDPPPADARPPYCVFPLQGEVGVEIQAEVLAKALDLAISRKHPFVVLEIDAAGGTLAQIEPVVEALIKAGKSTRLVGLVRRAEGAVAAIPLALRDVYVTSGAVLASADLPVPDDLTPQLSRMAWQTLFRSAAAAGGRDELLADAFADPAATLSYDRVGGQIRLTRRDGQVAVKEAGQPMRLNADAAVALGLAAGKAEAAASLSPLAGPRGWRLVPVGGGLLLRRSAEQARRQKTLAEAEQRRKEHLERIKPLLAELQKKIDAINEQGKLAENRLDVLRKQYKLEEEAIEAAYTQTLQEIGQWESDTGGNGRAMRNRARDLRDSQLRALETAYRPRVEGVQDEIRGLLKERKRIEDEMEALRKAPPKE